MSTNFALELRVSRRRAGLTQDDVAHLLETKQGPISDFERGLRFPSTVQLIKLSLIYGRTFEQLYAYLLHEARQELLCQLDSLPAEVRQQAGTFNRSDTIERLRDRLTAEIDAYDVAG